MIYGTQQKSLLQGVQLIELHAFACDLVCIYLSESFDFLKIRILHIVIILA